MAGRKLEIEIVGDASKLDKSLQQSQKSAGSWAGKFKMAGLAAGAGIGLVAVGLKKSADAAIESEKAQARLAQALKSAGIDAEKFGGQIESSIQSTSKLAAFDDEDLSDVFAKLARSTGSVKEATEGMGLAADIARARNISLEASSKFVEKALLGNETAFKRVGIEMEKGASVQETLAAAQAKFGGAAEAYGKTAAGAQERFGVAVENLQEKIGSKLLPILAKLMEVALKVIASIEKNWPQIMAVIGPVMEDVRRIIQEVIANVTQIWEQHGEKIMAYVKFVFGVIQQSIENAMRVIGGIIDVIMGVLTGDWQRAWDGVKNIVGGVFDAIKQLFSIALTVLGAAAKAIGTAILDGIVGIVKALPGAVWDLTKAIGTKYVEMYATVLGWGASLAKQLVGGLLDAVKGIGGKVWELTLAIGTKYVEMYATVLGWGADLAGKVVGGILDGLAGIGGKVWNIINDIGAKIREMGETIKDWGSSIIGKIVSGITGAAKDLWNAVTNIFDKLPGFVKKILGIGSPSKVFADIGHDLVAGLIKGLNDKAGALRAAAMDMAKQIAGDAWDKLSGVASAAGGAIAGAAGAVGGAIGIGGDGPTTGSGVGSGHVYGDIQGLASSFLLALNRMSGGHGIPISVQSGFRTYAEQAALVAQKGLWSPSNPTGAAAPGTSKHESGRAADITPGRPSWPFAGNYGLHFPIPQEPWHIEGYDKGGWLKPGVTMAINRTGRPERVLAPGQARGGGTVINNFNFPHYVGNQRELVDAVRKEVSRTIKRNG